MFAGLIIGISFIVFIVSVIIVGGNLFPFEWEAVKIGLSMCLFSVLTTIFALWCARD